MNPPPSPTLPGRLEAHLAASGLLAGSPSGGGPGAVVVALSGGGDSMALLHLLLPWAARTGAVLVPSHVAHGLRGDAGLADARFAADVARDLGLPFCFRSVETRELRRSGESLEAAARRLRYEALLGLAADLGTGTRGAPVPIATAHTLDDQAETVLLSLARHSGRTRGGIRARRADGVVRPLLPFSRRELRLFLEEAGLSWREDETNENERFERNRVRHRVLPSLEARWPGVAERLARAGAAWTSRIDAMDEAIDRALAGRGVPAGGPWPRDLFAALGPEAAGRLLLRAASRRGKSPGRGQLSRVLARLAGGEERLSEGLAGLVLAADARAVRLAPAARLRP
jgi:tRNA(Ile)-lysidine synthase